MSSIRLEYFLDDPELVQMHQLALPTNEMYRFFPPQEDIILPDSNPEKNYRFIFNGQPKTEYEKEKLLKFQEYEDKNGKLNYPENWLESDTMRLLQASEYDIKKAYKEIDENIKFLNNIPKTINNKVISLLNSGFLYVYGRDHHFRPIIVVSLKTLKDLMSKNEYTFEDINHSIIYLMCYVLKYIFIPGQIENWIILVDFKDIGLSDASDFKKILSTLSKFRGRVFRNYMLNISGFLKIAVKAALKVFGSSSAKKLKILGKDELNKLQEIISPDNIQIKYGGTAPDINPGTCKLFPPIMPSKNYAINGETLNIITESAYKDMCLYSKPYKPFVISPKYDELWRLENNEKESTKPSIKSSIKDNLEKINKEKIIRKQSFQNQSFQKQSIDSEKNKLELLKKKEELLRRNRLYINNFLKEFEGFYMLDNNEEKKYYIKSPVNIQDINSLFNKLQNNGKCIIKI